jgi:undecaprenyl-diphosphatase
LTILQAVVYGLVQGLGEFLPISSSAHLILVPWFFGWSDPGLTFDVALHAGTLVAVVLYFWRDWLKLVRKGLSDVRSVEGRLFWYLVVATIPGAVGGSLLEKEAETSFRAPLLIALMLTVMGVLLLLADRKTSKHVDMEHITFWKSLLIGLSQVLAIIPGVSRSGVTMTTALFAGITRADAARFSFLLSTPVVLGAAMIKLPHVISHPSLITPDFLTGMAVSFVSGIASIGFLLRYVQRRSFALFVWYRFALAALVLLVLLVR